MSLEIVPVTLRQAAAFVLDLHRHNKPPRGHKLSLGCADAAGVLHGVACIGRPSARAWDDGRTAEVTRTCTDGTANVNSMLYGAAWRVAKAQGYRRICTYTQGDENGVSLRAAGWFVIGRRKARASWAESTQDERLHAMRDPEGNGGVARVAWGQGDWS